ncbi:single-stranded DNA-binding protein [Scrofimicrobium sp. R131]|uniref:Single-stranded DNA-binding protein n=1 Tax=Scrofimicrobium appendicitidis TaxID=3079930 RepID=A0AAU7V601_9ACTO
MSFRGQTTGAIANPVLRWTGQQRAVLELRIHSTASARNKDTGEWHDVGDQLWISASFWDQEAQKLADVLQQGDRVTVEGTLVIESYQRRDGTSGVSHSLRSPRFLGVIPSRRSEAAPPADEFGPITSDTQAPF